MSQPIRPAEATRVDKVREMWDRAAEPGFRYQTAQTNWFGHPEIQRHVNRSCSGSEQRDWVQHFVDTYLLGRRPQAVVNLGCGEGALERQLIDRGFAETYVGYDLSERCVAHANDTIGRHHPNARFVCADLNHLELPRAAFDVAIVSHALHHVERLEHLCGETRHALKPDGFLLVNEFVGPSRHQWSDRQLAIVNRLLDQFAPHLRRDISRRPADVPRGRVTRMTTAEWLRCDPSEAVRSAEILPVVERHFEILERRDFGGTVLQKLLENVVGNFDPANEDHSTIVRLLIAFESILIEEGVLGSDFTFAVARPRLV